MGVPTKELCYGCRRPIDDRFLLRVMDQSWHERCVQCCVCLQPLDRSCYIKDSQLYCKPDYERSVCIYMYVSTLSSSIRWWFGSAIGPSYVCVCVFVR